MFVDGHSLVLILLPATVAGGWECGKTASLCQFSKYEKSEKNVRRVSCEFSACIFFQVRRRIRLTDTRIDKINELSLPVTQIP